MSDVILPRNIPRYQLLAEQLITGIANGEFPLGSCLPTEAVLRNQYSVSRFTVREAMKILQQKGLIATRRGVGSEVISQFINEEVYSFSSDSYTDFLTNAAKTRLSDIEINDVVCDENLALKMRSNPGHKMLRVCANRVASQAGSSFVVGRIETYIIACYAGVRHRIGEQQSINKMIETLYGVETAEIQQRILPLIIGTDLASHLGVKPGSAGLKTTRAYLDKKGEIFEYVTNYHAGEHAELTMNIKRGQ